MKKFKREDYNELFRYENKMTVLHSEFFAKGSMKKGGVLITSNEKNWNSFIHKEKEKECLKAGLDIFSSKEKYNQYSRSFRKYIKNIAKPIILKYSKIPSRLTKSELELLLEDLSLLWYYYGFTEYSYHDLAHKIMLEYEDDILKKNLADLGRLKFIGREILNAYTFKDGVISNILEFLSQKFLKGDEANFLLSHELLGLFSNSKISQDIISNRKKYYTFSIKEGCLYEHEFKEAKKIHREFTKISEVDKLEGIVANKGRVVGKVIIAPMLNDQFQVDKIITKMEKGNILVAQTTSPEYMPLCKLASAIITDQGGMLSHAAIVSRELGIPCIVGTNIATKIFKNGDSIEVDAFKGVIKKIT
ncbi:MAG: Pyruvate phosphate dikinase, PEP/pyruvate-binding domain protein [Candidatus Moranbacteria bacterium GW2011_GWF2_36_839]|nr:MAG: Pyruvate phosphate dikinase, PEP/pyruvate-binding domain protein [Candidatus Moranbacteria bacterium GW2011_GWF1_36_78]KKQ16724.1 MAG: Pyruvate phosphate dikinase, PEP/pyruvate-binding domain protein [Candidatus Moranbacteria bacterium GW2011_GWF2_36_839]HAT74237.1 hypothetical protein [Candidatus Moranbacteria bacterium]HBY11395.1 hypothetical protein [Candidatus Moranbacteria bacterium]